MRLAASSLCAALLCSFALPASGEVSEEDRAWALSLKRDGWRPIQASKTQAIFLSPAPAAPGAFRRSWIRFEHRQLTDGLRSWVSLGEFDCDQLRVRELSFTAYDANNMSGEATVLDDLGDWSYAAPGSNMGFIVHKVCDP